jgi:hypothetical protein
MNENQKKWAKVYGSLLKKIFKLYVIDKTTFIKETKATEASLQQWKSGSRFPPDIYNDNICKVLKKIISDQKNITRNRIMAEIIKNNFKDLYDEIDIIDPDNKMGEYISDLLIICHSKGNLTPQEPTVPLPLTDVGDTLDTGPVAPAPYSDASTGVIDTNELTPGGFDSPTAGKKNDRDDPVGSVTFSRIPEFEKWLSDRRENEAAAAYTVKLKVDELGGNAWTRGSLGYIFRANGNKFIDLDLSGSTFKEIGERVFYGCTSLVSITIPNDVEKIGVGVFRDCTSLTKVPIPNNVRSIGSNAFDNCTNLTSITIPNSVTNIENWAFYECTKLNITWIYNPALTAITFRDYLKTVIIPDSVTNIGKCAFEGCTNLTSVTFKGANTELDNSHDHSLGDLRNKYLAGGKGTYITTAPVGSRSVWTKQPN